VLFDVIQLVNGSKMPELVKMSSNILEPKQNTAELTHSNGVLSIATLNYAKENLELSDKSETSKIPPVKARHGQNSPISRSSLRR